MMLDLGDARTQRALVIAADAGQWAKCHTADGRKAYAIPSSRDTTRRYLATSSSCTCPDFARRGEPCKHARAVAIHVALLKALN